MKVYVVYATRHGSTGEIAERIAHTLERHGLDVQLQSAGHMAMILDADAFVIGAAAYLGHWLKDATRFIKRHEALLRSHPVWLFSSGPIGTAQVDAKGRDVLVASRPVEFDELSQTLPIRGERVFFGKWDPDAPPIGLAERLGSPFMRLNSVRSQAPSGDFRDWAQIEAWADGIAEELGAGQAIPTTAG